MVQIIKSDLLTNTNIFENIAMNDSVWDDNKVSIIVNISLVISVHGYITNEMF